MQNKMAAMRKVDREWVRCQAKRGIIRSTSAGRSNWRCGATSTQVERPTCRRRAAQDVQRSDVSIRRNRPPPTNSPGATTGPIADDRGEVTMASKIIFACVLVSTLSFLAVLGSAEDAPPPALHQTPWPIYHERQHQPTQDELKTQHQQDVTPDQAGDIDRLYDQLLSNSDKLLKQHPALVR
jgi:hypothetical protein